LFTKKAEVPLTNNTIILERLIYFFRHLKNQNPSTGYDFIHSSGLSVSSNFGHLRDITQLSNDPSCQGDLFSHLDSLNIKICPLVQISRGNRRKNEGERGS